jgi:hypothetical protein
VPELSLKLISEIAKVDVLQFACIATKGAALRNVKTPRSERIVKFSRLKDLQKENMAGTKLEILTNVFDIYNSIPINASNEEQHEKTNIKPVPPPPPSRGYPSSTPVHVSI